VSELPLPYPLANAAFKVARDQIVEVIQDWGAAWWQTEVKGHAGRVTREYLIREGGLPPRAVVSVLDASSSKVGGGKMTVFNATWQLFIVLGGTIEDRTADGLTLAGEACRLVTVAPWLEVDDSMFVKPPLGGSIRMRSLYADPDERSGMTVWGLQWEQAIDLGSAGRTPDPVGEALASIMGTSEVPGEPNTETVETEVT
jgi:hypothetical protein